MPDPTPAGSGPGERELRFEIVRAIWDAWAYRGRTGEDASECVGRIADAVLAALRAATPPGAASGTREREAAVTERLSAAFLRLGEVDWDDDSAGIIREVESSIGAALNVLRAAAAPSLACGPRERLEALRQLAPNWDSYGAPAISPVAIWAAREWLDAVQVVPTSHGGVQLEWHRDGWDIEVEFDAAGAIAACWLVGAAVPPPSGEPGA